MVRKGGCYGRHEAHRIRPRWNGDLAKVVGHDLGGRQRNDHLFTGLREVRERRFVDIEGDAFAQTEVDERPPLFFLLWQRVT